MNTVDQVHLDAIVFPYAYHYSMEITNRPTCRWNIYNKTGAILHVVETEQEAKYLVYISKIMQAAQGCHVSTIPSAIVDLLAEYMDVDDSNQLQFRT